jgi:hypothetical protein
MHNNKVRGIEMETQDECIFYEDFPMRTRPLPEGVYIAYRVPGTKRIETAQVLHAGYYVMLAKDSQGNEHFIFYPETLAASSSLDTLKRKLAR